MREVSLSLMFASLMLLVVSSPVLAQAPTGTITGLVTDATGARVPGVRITIVNADTRLTRNVLASSQGTFSAATLIPGIYRVIGEANGFRRVEITTTVNAGTSRPLTLTMEVGNLTEQVTVNDRASSLSSESNQISGIIERMQIESVPLNGRNFLDLARLEPGVTSPIRGTNNRIFVPILGAGTQNFPRIGRNRVTVDGADIDYVNAMGPALQVSQDAVQEFQLSSTNFDPVTSLTTSGAINIVTRSGSNDFHGAGFYLYRDHHLAAYPALARDATNPDPFFERQQVGFQFGGPLKEDRLFYFVSYEHNDQRGVLSVQPRTPEFVPLGGIFASPYHGNQFNLRLDIRINSKNNALVRYTHDGNSLFGPFDGRNTSLPSGWSTIRNWVDQSIFGLTTIVSQNVINDFRFSYFFSSSPEIPATSSDCPGCFGLGAPPITIADAGVSFGTARRLSAVGRRYQLTDGLVWQRENHRWRFGFDWEHATPSGASISQEPAGLNLYSPREVRDFNATVPASARIPLPTSFLTLSDFLQLPLRSFTTAVGPGQVLQRDFLKYRIADLYRIYAADTWQIGPSMTLNYGLAWSYEPNALNVFLTKPELLAPIVGSDHLNPPKARTTNFSPTLGFVWGATHDGKTMIRLGTGLYYDQVAFNTTALANERQALFPLGTGRKSIPGSAIFFPGVGFLNFPKNPTSFSAADLLSILPAIRAALEAQLNPDNRDFTIRNINLDKTASNLSDPFYQTPYALHFSLGIQRELSRSLILTADFAWRRFLHTFMPDMDYNRFNSLHGSVINPCTPSQKNDPTASCSSGPITFDTTSGIAEYKGMLVRVEKRLTHHTQFLASYALGSFVGSNGNSGPGNPATGFNNDNWFQNYGPLPTDIRHILNASGLIELPHKFQVSYNVSYYSAAPFSAYVANMDFNGDGTVNDLLPGTTVNQFNRGLAKSDLAQLVQDYNQQYAGKRTLGGQLAPTLSVPADYSFNDSFFTQDLRLSRSFALKKESIRLNLFGEIFNLFNTANLVQYGGNLAEPRTFGRPAARFSQVFGSGGPRAVQLGARISF